MSEYYEFTVCLKDASDKDVFVQQMASDVKMLESNIPSRSCKVISEHNKYIQYKLTHEEHKELKKDPRVLAVRQDVSHAKPVLYDSNHGMSSRFRDFMESNNVYADKHFRRLQDKKRDQLRLQNYTGDEFAKVSLPTSSGIDIVVVDEIVAPNHIEFTESADPDYGSEDAAYVTKLTNTNSNSRVYTIGGYIASSINGYHGTHVAGTAAGKTQGWCRDARIINSDFQLFTSVVSDGQGGSAGNYSQNILNWHNFKITNGINRPTIVNHSWGIPWQSSSQVEEYPWTIRMSWVNSIYYRGTTYHRSSFPAWPTELLSSPSLLTVYDRWHVLYEHWLYFFLEKGICFYELGNVSSNASSEAEVIISPIAILNTSINNAIKAHTDAGIITCCAAGNDSWPILDGSTSSDPFSDWHNSINFTDPNTGITYDLEYNQGGSPANATNDDSIIIVGNMDHNNYKAMSSQCGTAITVYAPGQEIKSSVKPVGITSDGVFDEHELYAKLDGTSMACPQVCGVLGLVAQQQINNGNPWPMDNSNAQASGVAYLTSSSYNNLYDSNVPSGTVQEPAYTFEQKIGDGLASMPWAAEAGTSLRGSPNRVLFFDTDVLRCGEALDKPPCLWGECDIGDSGGSAGGSSDTGSDTETDGGDGVFLPVPEVSEQENKNINQIDQDIQEIMQNINNKTANPDTQETLQDINDNTTNLDTQEEQSDDNDNRWWWLK